MFRIVTISGSLQAASKNRTLLETLVLRAPLDLHVAPTELVSALPLFNPDIERDGTPHVVGAFRRTLSDADAVVFATPEYGHSLPGSLKNAIDWVIPSGELHQKPVAITAAVTHPERGLLGLGALETSLRALDARIVFNEVIVFNDDSDLALDRLLMILRGALD
jgi:chromate reductase